MLQKYVECNSYYLMGNDAMIDNLNQMKPKLEAQHKSGSK